MKGDAVPRRFIAALSQGERKPFVGGSGRLEMAEAIADPGNPLTARVMANRVWQRLFGSGLVITPSDFGVRAEPPSHPALLDFLAADFIENGWSVKALIRGIVTSNTYQQGETVYPQYAERDPGNRLLWQMNRKRLDFEAMRDSVLSVSGNLDLKQGGRSVRIANKPDARLPDGLRFCRSAKPAELVSHIRLCRAGHDLPAALHHHGAAAGVVPFEQPVHRDAGQALGRAFGRGVSR